MSTHDYGTAEVVSYSYDTLNRLSTATGSGWGENFTYDGFGNVTDKTVTSGSAPPLHVTVNATNNRINGYNYDNNGNMTTPPGLTTASVITQGRSTRFRLHRR